jgi:hypothetical protein
MKRIAATASLALLSAALQAQTSAVPATDAAADAAPSLRPVTVTTPRGEVVPFDMPGSVDLVDRQQLRDGRLQVNLSESLGGVPGLQVQNRQNYAQDLQISIRGFGARSTFGLRGVRLYIDGIPATLPDGQGQSSNIDIGSADRVEVLRGPFSALYGNSSGGVIQVFTEDGEGPPTLGLSAAGGSDGTYRLGARASGASGNVDYVLSTSRFRTDGWRDHSAATRDIGNAKLGLRLDDGSKLTLVANSVRIDAQDPLGLTQAQLDANRRGAALATQYDTRKTVDQTQLGLLYEKRVDARNDLRLMLYGGERETTQFQSIPPATQANPLSAGGVIDLKRRYAGLDARWTSHLQLAGSPFDLAFGVAYDTLDEKRRGYENFLGTTAAPRQLGTQGRLRRDERNTVSNVDPYLQTRWDFAERWSLEAGVRRSSVRFDSDDRYVRGINGDDSGDARYGKTLPAAALRYAATRDLNLYVSAGAQRALLPPERQRGPELRAAAIGEHERRGRCQGPRRRRPADRGRVPDPDRRRDRHRDQRRRPCHVPERGTHETRRLRARLAARDRRPLAHAGRRHLARCALQRRIQCRSGRQPHSRHRQAVDVRVVRLRATAGLACRCRTACPGPYRGQRCQHRERAWLCGGGIAGRLRHALATLGVQRLRPHRQHARSPDRRFGHCQRRQRALFRTRARSHLDGRHRRNLPILNRQVKTFLLADFYKTHGTNNFF